MLEKLKYPIGRFKAVTIDTPYRDGGWTLRQVVHHLPDSHINAYIRFKLAITEDRPSIKPYREDLWAECEEAKHGPIQDSLDLLDALHRRWVAFLRTLEPQDFLRTYYHPAQDKEYDLGIVLSLYVWHGEHHLSHITETKKRKGWVSKPA